MIWALPALPSQNSVETAAETAPAQSEKDKTPAVKPSTDKPVVVVVTRKKTDPLEGIEADERLDEQAINTYDADTIAELLGKLGVRIGEESPQVLINGRRVDSSAIAQLPPEALAHVDVLPPSAAGKFGYDSGHRVLNLQLKPKFDSLSALGNAAIPTEGGGANGSIALTSGRIRGDRNLIASLNYRHSDGLLQSARVNLAIPASDGTLPPLGNASLLSLSPRQNSLNAYLNYGQPIGALNFNIGLNGGQSQTRRLAGLSTVADTNTGQFGLITQSTNLKNIHLTTSLGGYQAKSNWSLSASLSASWADIDSQLSTGQVNTRLSSTQSYNHGLSLSGFYNLPLFTLPTGEVNLSLNLSQDYDGATSRRSANCCLATTSTYTSRSGGAAFSLPLSRRKPGTTGGLGDLSLSNQLSYSQANGIRGVVGNRTTLNWSPSKTFYMAFTASQTPSLPSAQQLNAPVISTPGLSVYDYQRGAITTVTLVTGGVDQLKKQVNTSYDVSAHLNARFGTTALSVSGNFGQSDTTNPVISTTSTLPAYEAAFPDHYVRDAAGVLTQIDTRPVNAVRQTRQFMSLTANLSGPRPLPTQAPQTSEPPSAPPPAPISWSASLSYNYTVKDALDLKSGLPPINLLVTPAAAAEAPSRHRVTLTGNLETRNWSGDIRVSWRGAASATSIGSGALVTTHSSSLFRVDAGFAASIGRHPKDSGASSTRLKGVTIRINVQNLFDARPTVYSVSQGRKTYVQPWLLDPMGRVISVALSKAF